MANQRNQPKRPTRADYIADRARNQIEMECDKMAAVVDRKARQMSEKWGEDKLPELVSPEMARKFGSALSKLNDALAEQDPDQVQLRAEVCVRGLDAMDAEAEATGQPKASGDFWQIPGTNYAVMKDGMEWRRCKADQPDLIFISLQEVLTALKALKLDTPMFAEIKAQFPPAEIKPRQETRPRRTKALNDPIPF